MSVAAPQLLATVDLAATVAVAMRQPNQAHKRF